MGSRVMLVIGLRGLCWSRRLDLGGGFGGILGEGSVEGMGVGDGGWD